jgi:hypothetical protein
MIVLYSIENGQTMDTVPMNDLNRVICNAGSTLETFSYATTTNLFFHLCTS